MINLGTSLGISLGIRWIESLIRPRAPCPLNAIDQEKITEFVQKFGKNSNSFMTLYKGFNYFTSSDPRIEGVIAYVDMPFAWVGGAEPLCEPQYAEILLDEFAKTAALSGKSAVLLPISAAVAQKALNQGYSSILIGGEPTFDLAFYPRTGKTWVDVISTAKILDSKGAKVVEFNSESCTPEKKAELDSITKEWLESRKMDPLGFLNKVEPWTLSKHKRYFSLELPGELPGEVSGKLSGQTLAFLAAIPIWPRKGWYLIDVLRRNDAPAGTTELLTLQAMKILKESGALEITLGVSPLAMLNEADSIPLAHAQNHWRLYPFLKFLYEKSGNLYGFKTLFQYKLKFDPTRNEPAFLIFKNSRKGATLSLPIVISVFQAFSQYGILRAIGSGLSRSLRLFKLSDLIKGQLRPTVVVRSVPRSRAHLLYRCKLTLTLLILNSLIFILSTQSEGTLQPELESTWAYSWSSFIQHPVHSLSLSPFLHWNLLHLNTNLVLMILFMGGLEYIAGTGFTSLCTLSALILSNPLTSLTLIPLGLSYPAEIDVGASLGIFGCAGALSLFLNHRFILLGSLALATLIQGILTQHWIGLNHLTAVLLGLSSGLLMLRR